MTSESRTRIIDGGKLVNQARVDKLPKKGSRQYCGVITKQSEHRCPRCSRAGLFYEPVASEHWLDAVCLYCGYRVSRVKVS